MELLCPICDRSIIQNPSEYNENITTMRRKVDKSLYESYTNNIINLDKVDKILSDYVTTHKKTCFYFVRCEFVLEFDNKYIANSETKYCVNMDGFIIKKNYLLYFIDC